MQRGWPPVGMMALDSARWKCVAVLALMPCVSCRVPQREIDRDDVIIGNGGYPRGLQLLSGTRLVCVGMDIYSSISPGQAVQASSWAKLSTVLTDSRLGVDLANCNLAQLPSGRILASYRHHVPVTGGGAENPPKHYAIEVSASDDNGTEWTPLSTVVSGPVGMWEPFLWPPTASSHGGGDNVIWAAYSQELTNGGLQSIVWQRSTDQGASWAAPLTISDGRQHRSRDGMPGITRLGDGSLLLVFEGHWDFFFHNRTESRRHFSVQARQSQNEGATWSDGGVIFSPPDGSKGINAGAPQVIASAGESGEFFVSFMTDEELGTVPGNWVSNAQVR